MPQLPDIWRTEVWHPLTVHFPIALLLAALLFKTIALKSTKPLWSEGGAFLLLLGTLGAWVAVYTGDRAEGIVARLICDPTILKDHENASLIMAWIFTGALALEAVSYWQLLKIRRFLGKILVVLLMLTGAGFLTYTAHLGATLVYQQGAGVYHPSEDCREFE